MNPVITWIDQVLSQIDTVGTGVDWMKKHYGGKRCGCVSAAVTDRVNIIAFITILQYKILNIEVEIRLIISRQL